MFWFGLVSETVSAALSCSLWLKSAQRRPTYSLRSVSREKKISQTGTLSAQGEHRLDLRVLSCFSWMVGEVSKNTWLLSAVRNSPQAVTIHQGDFTVCVRDRESMLTPHFDFSVWPFGLTEGEQR